MNFYSIEFEKHSGGKLRKFNNPSPDLRKLINEVSIELKMKFPNLESPNRIQQSINDINCYKKFSHVKLLDIKKALLSGNLLFICLAMAVVYPRTIPLLPKILKIYSAPVIKNTGNAISSRNYRLKAGFRTSEQLLNILFMMPMRIFNLNGSSRLYVDDVILFSNQRIWLNFSFYFITLYFYFLGFKFHKVETYDLRKRPKKCGQRLGLYFGFSRSGKLLTKVRPRTLRKYQSRIKKSIQYVNVDQGVKRVGKIIYGKVASPSYPLCATFNKQIWSDTIQRKQFFAKCCGDLKLRFPELRKFKKEELLILLKNGSLIF